MPLSAVTFEKIYILVFVILLFTMAICWIAFARLCMTRIEKSMEKDGLPRPARWDGVGARVLWYCHAVVIPLGSWNLPNDPFFDVISVRRYAKPLDRKLGLAVMISGYSFTVIVLMGAWVFDI